MPFIPHTEDDVREMLADIGVSSVEQLFDEIPANLLVPNIDIPPGQNEMQIARVMAQRASSHQSAKCYIGAGAYEHYIPAAIWDVTQRGEFLTAYTPYQAEASQGTLQLLFEYQTMMSSLMGLEVSNASLYEGASALVEAILMACRLQKEIKSVWLPGSIHPSYLEVVRTFLRLQRIEMHELPLPIERGFFTRADLHRFAQQLPTCSVLVIPQPNFLGSLEKVDELTDWAHEQGALVIGVVNPIAMAWLKPPGQWGKKGADIACGEGQPLGVPLAHGGPYFGFLCTRMEFVRQLPGRIVGRTVDKDGKDGFTLTLQAREQHIRRAKATSNICTNQGLLVTAATIYMSLMGPDGLKTVAQTAFSHTQYLINALNGVSGVKVLYSSSFHEFVLQLNTDAAVVVAEMQKKGISCGLLLEPYFPELKNCLLVCVTETKTKEDLDEYISMITALVKHNCVMPA